MYHRSTIACATCALAALVAFGAYTFRPQPVVTQVRTRFERTGTTLDGWAWAAQPWTGDDKPYQQIRKNIYNEIASGQNAEELLARYKAQAEAKPADPQAQFAWAYAALRLSAFPGRQDTKVDLTGLPDALAGAPYPRTYDYARIRFLAQASLRPMGQLEELGKRLAQRDPADVPVKFRLIQVLRQIPSPPENAQAVRLAEEFVKSDPQQLIYRATLANVYEDAFVDFGSKKSSGDKAIAAYQEYLRLASPDDPNREGVERTIKGLQDIEARSH